MRLLSIVLLTVGLFTFAQSPKNEKEEKEAIKLLIADLKKNEDLEDDRNRKECENIITKNCASCHFKESSDSLIKLAGEERKISIDKSKNFIIKYLNDELQLNFCNKIENKDKEKLKKFYKL